MRMQITPNDPNQTLRLTSSDISATFQKDNPSFTNHNSRSSDPIRAHKEAKAYVLEGGCASVSRIAPGLPSPLYPDVSNIQQRSASSDYVGRLWRGTIAPFLFPGSLSLSCDTP